MRAARFHRHGDPSVLRVEQTAWPFPKGDELLVRVHASSVNGTDLNIRRGGGPIGLLTRLPFTVGFDVAGEVVACGELVTAFEPGDRVVALLGHGGGGAAEY
ncbi:alcohol dehydrogenase catalytic domain-containing protein, partial [Deinococcus pimensis]|uniref:alcohol dehydrogenase catalytic domain-containing protein n=1 Tax=Deinococcus pimensis TaxID=309888 RepID=UPI0004847760